MHELGRAGGSRGRGERGVTDRPNVMLSRAKHLADHEPQMYTDSHRLKTSRAGFPGSGLSRTITALTPGDEHEGQA